MIIFFFDGSISSMQEPPTLLLEVPFEVLMSMLNNSLRPEVFSTRRQWMTGVAGAVGGLAFGSRVAWAADNDGLSRIAEAIHQETIFKASPHRIYEALTDVQQFQKVQLLSGTIKGRDLKAKPAQISREPGGPFSIFGDYIIGRQLELVPDQRICPSMA